MPHDADGELDLSGVAEQHIIRVPNSAFRLDIRDRWETISHWYDRKSLFPHEPRMDDVRQSSIPDCFLLAALHSTIQVDPRLVLGMIRDLRGGWVVVRLFDGAAPVYYKIEKDFLTNPDLDIARHGAPWVYMVEKAFAHFRLVRHFQCTPLSWNALTRTWDHGAKREARTYREALTGGQPYEVFPILTGGQGAVHDIDAERGSSRPASTLVHVVRVDLDGWIDLNAEQQAAFRAVFGRFTGPEVIDLVRNNTVQKRIALVSLFYPVGGNDYEKIVRAETLATYFDTHYAALQPATRLAIDNYIGANFPGKRGTGRYTTQQLALYNQINTAITGRQMVVLSTSSTLGRNPGAPGTSGENKVKGLAGPHAYQVIECPAPRGGLRYVKLRNPWLNYGRAYVPKVLPNGQNVLSAQPVAPGGGDNGVFEVELSDITKRFLKLHVGVEAGRLLP